MFHKIDPSVFPLHYQAMHGNLVQIASCLPSSQIHSQDYFGNQPIHYAVASNSPKKIRLLATHGADLNSKNSDGFAPISLAIKMGHFEALQELVNLEVNLEIRTEGEELSIIHLATIYNREKILDFLIRLIPRSLLDAQNHFGASPLHYAADLNLIDIALRLTYWGASTDRLNQMGYSPIHGACISGNKEMSFILIQASRALSLPSAEGLTALHYAINEMNHDAIKCLLHFNADPNEKTAYGATPLELACLKNDPQAVGLLIAYKANPSICNDSQETPLHIALQRTDIDSTISDLLIHSSKNLCLKNKEGETPLHIAARNGCFKQACLIASHDIKLNIKDKFNQSPSTLAFTHGHDELGSILKLLEVGEKLFKKERKIIFSKYMKDTQSSSLKKRNKYSSSKSEKPRMQLIFKK
jgi:ankyrin repeat protein